MADVRDGGRVAVLGTGIMGSAMARNLVSAGLPTAVWDRSASVMLSRSAISSLPGDQTG